MRLNQEELKRAGIKMGSMPEQWMPGTTKDITFCVTEDCNLRCRYCYMTSKNSMTKMSFEVAKQAADFFLSNRDQFNEEAVVFNFIGGEPFLEIELIDRICEYLTVQMYKLDHPWFHNHMFNFATNGLLYDSPKVQEYINKYRAHLCVGISIDGNKVKHDLQRIKEDGSGSYDSVVKNVPLWLKQFPTIGTKSTFSHDDLPYLRDSIISLWDLGIKMVAANIVFEDVWQDGDDEIFETQLKELADYIIDNNLWKDYSVRFFSADIGHPISEESKKQNYCGAGKMISVDCSGNLYPCIRFCDLSLANRKGKVIGDIYNGINYDLLRPFQVLSMKAQSLPECLDCEVGSGCAWCSGANYDFAETDTVYQRAIYHCKMHKANVRAKEYFWNKLSKVDPTVNTVLNSAQEIATNGLDEKSSDDKFLLFITSDDITPHCSYRNWHGTNNVMSEESFDKALAFAKNNNMYPIILGDLPNKKDELYGNSLSISAYNSNSPLSESIRVFDNKSGYSNNSIGNCILIVTKNNIEKISEFVKDLYKSNNRINLILEDIADWSERDISLYEKQLDILNIFIADTYRCKKPIEINVLTDIMEHETMHNCDAGESSFSVAPNGKIYICPSFYFNNPDDSIGSIDDGINIPNNHLMKLENAGICMECDAYQCRRCKFMNKKSTCEINIPSKRQCVISHIERKKSIELQKMLQEHQLRYFDTFIKDIDYLDPLEKIFEMTKPWKTKVLETL